MYLRRESETHADSYKKVSIDNRQYSKLDRKGLRSSQVFPFLIIYYTIQVGTGLLRFTFSEEEDDKNNWFNTDKSVTTDCTHGNAVFII